MSVKIVEKEEYAKARGGGKREQLTADIEEIVSNRIEYCELEDFPYSDKTSISSIMDWLVRVFATEFKRESGVYPEGYTSRWWDSTWRPPFIMKKVHDGNRIRVFCTFYVKTWERQIEQAKKKE